MSRIFGEMRQIAFVVPDINRAMKYWSETLGVGPFSIKRNLVLEHLPQSRNDGSRRSSMRCGTGGTVKEGIIEIQGDHRDRLVIELEKMGYKVKRVGG